MTTTLTLYPPPPSSPHWHDRPHGPDVPQEPYFSHITRSGKDALWVAFVIFTASNLIIAMLAARYERKHRIFHYTNMLITGVAALSYFAMATNTGFTFVNTGVHIINGEETTVFRQVFWARYVDWAITTPLLILNLCLLSGTPCTDTIGLIIADITMILSGAFAALTEHHGSRWVWFTFATLLLFYIFGKLLWDGRRCAKMQSASVTHLYTGLYLFVVIVWIMYPLFFALGEITATISSNVETIIYCILDILAKAVFALWLLCAHKHTAEDNAAVLPKWMVEVRGAHESGAIQIQHERPLEAGHPAAPAAHAAAPASPAAHAAAPAAPAAHAAAPAAPAAHAAAPGAHA